MNSIVKKILLIFMGVLVVGTLVGILIMSVSSGGKKDKAEFKDVDDHTMFVDETTPLNAEEETTEIYVYVPPSPTDARKSSDDKTDYSANDADSNSGSKYTAEQSTDDRRAPVILVSRSNVVLKVGETFDVHSYIGYGDDVDRDVDLTIDGQVDTSKKGIYPISLILKDDAGHDTRFNMTVRVVESSSDDGGAIDAGGPPPNGESFADFKRGYKTPSTSLGIDVSRWQNTIDFQKVKDAGCDFVIMRLGGYDDGKHYTDAQFRSNIKNAKAAGLKIGIYWHAEESSADEVEASVKYMLDELGGEDLDFPIAYDWEDFLGFEKYKMNLQDINDNFEVFADAVEKQGYQACLYSSKNFMDNVWTNNRNHKIWLAHYTSSTNYTGNYYMWQHTSSGVIDGINTAVDFNVLYNDR